MRAPVQDRVAAGVGTAVVVAALGAALVAGLTVDLETVHQRALAVFDVALPPPPPPRPVEHPRIAPRAKGPAAPRNLKNKATPVVAPPPLVVPPSPPPIVAAPKANTGAAAQTGASDRPGPGEGAGGRGDGNGGGGDGDGDGDDSPPEQVRGRLSMSDMPRELAAPGADYTVGVRYHVEVDGRVGSCAVTRTSGSAALDTRVCDLIRQRFRFEPSRRPDGRPVGAYIREDQRFTVERADDER